MRLSPVLADADLTPAELQAARLDGEVYTLAGAYCLIGELEAPGHRARAVLTGRSPRLIAALDTAAWIWGARQRPRRLDFAVTPDARIRLSPDELVSVRESLYEDGDLATLAEFRVTTPLRTALDLARARDGVDSDTLHRLAAIGGFRLDDCIAALEARHGIPSKRPALRRLKAMTPLTP